MMSIAQSDNMHVNDKDPKISADVEICASQAIREDFFPSLSLSPPALPKPKADSPTTMQSRSIWSDKTKQFIGCQSLYGSGRTHVGFTLPSSPPNETLSDQHPTAQASSETTISAGSIWPSMDQVDAAHSYGVRREDGMYSRLIRAENFLWLSATSLVFQNDKVQKV